jgi:DNA modification methylase
MISYCDLIVGNNTVAFYKQDATGFLNSLRGKYNLQIHDIPYVVSSDNANIKFNTRKDMVTDFGEWDKNDIDFATFARLCSERATENGSVLVFFNNWMKYSYLASEFAKYFDSVDCLVWHKTNPRPQVRKRNFTMCHELILWAKRGNYILNFTDHADMLSVKTHSVCSGNKRLKDEEGNTLHPTQKPYTLIQYYIERLSNPGDTILDAYAGCCTTAYASVACGRNSIVNEREEKYLKAGINWIKTKGNSNA